MECCFTGHPSRVCFCSWGMGVGQQWHLCLLKQHRTVGDKGPLKASTVTECAFGSPRDGEVEGAVMVLLSSRESWGAELGPRTLEPKSLHFTSFLQLDNRFPSPGALVSQTISWS